MSLDQWNKNGDGNQMSLFDYQEPKAIFVPAKPSLESYEWNNLYVTAEPAASKAPRFLTMSALLHAAALIAVAVMAVPLVQELDRETVTIEIEDLNPSPEEMALGNDVLPTQGSPTTATAKAQAAEMPEPANAEDISVAALPKELPSKAVAQEAAPLVNKVVETSAKPLAPKTTMQAVPATIDDIEAPELEAGTLDKVPVAAALQEEDLAEDLAQAHAQTAADLDKEKKSLAAMASALAEEQNENLESLAQANQEEEARLKTLQDQLREKNAAAIAAAAEQEAKAALAAQEAEEAAGAVLGDGGLGENAGPGAGNNGALVPNDQLAGSPMGVRSLDQLRQMPGNPRPQYDRIERRRGDQGEVAFLAYISKEGLPTRFRLQKSTGFRNLDGKTLAALKKWRFYPGQEGWVEIPFRWDLKGGVQQDGGTLRRSATNQ